MYCNVNNYLHGYLRFKFLMKVLLKGLYFIFMDAETMNSTKIRTHENYHYEKLICTKVLIADFCSINLCSGVYVYYFFQYRVVFYLAILLGDGNSTDPPVRIVPIFIVSVYSSIIHL